MRLWSIGLNKLNARPQIINLRSNLSYSKAFSSVRPLTLTTVPVSYTHLPRPVQSCYFDRACHLFGSTGSLAPTVAHRCHYRQSD